MFNVAALLRKGRASSEAAGDVNLIIPRDGYLPVGVLSHCLRLPLGPLFYSVQNDQDRDGDHRYEVRRF